MALYERFGVIESWTFEKGVTMYQLVNVRVRMPDQAKAREGDVWGLYLSGEDLQRAVRSWPLGRYLRLSLSPGTRAFSVTGLDIEEGRVDLLAEGVLPNDLGEEEPVAVAYTVWAEDLEYGQKIELMNAIRVTYSIPRPPIAKVRRSVAEAIGASILGH